MRGDWLAQLPKALGTLALGALASVALGQQKLDIAPRATVAIRDARLVPVSGDVIERGTIVIRDGKIAAIGPTAAIPSGAQVIDGKGLTVYPGMIDAATSLGLVEIPAVAATVDQGEVGDYNPNARALVAINPHSAHVRVTRYNGITTVATMPDGGVICGQATLINLYGTSPQEMAVVPSLGLVINFPRLNLGGGGPFAAFRQPPPSNLAEAIATRNRRVEELRQVMREATDYARAKEAAAADPKIPRPATNVVYESLLPTLRGETPAFFRADRAQDIRAALAFAEDMGIRPIIVGGNEASACAAELKAKGVPVILTGVLDLPSREDDPYDMLYENAAKLHRAGVKFCISTGDNGAHVRDLPYHAGMAAAFGLDPREALRAVTLSPAEALGISDRLGSLEVGKMANIVVADGDLLEPRTRVKYAFIDGRPAQLTSRHTELYEQFKERK
ncbi:MAG: amidohydrolase [Chloracidobacterium sp. CP2_5A]|nr:MAG: amidohydrolase [Chloracidobacterium sp. CP2_5A]